MKCINCDMILREEMAYCHSCGGKVIKNRLTMRHLLEHFSETFLNYDNKFLQTFFLLFKRPEEVITNYLDGGRKKYVNVITYFAIALTVSGIQIFIMNKFFPDSMNVDILLTDGAEEMQRKGMSFTQEYQSILYMLFVPLYAIISKIVFFNKKTFNYTEHLVINMYLLAHLSILSVILTLLITFIGFDYGVSVLWILFLQTIYSAYAFKRLFNLTLGSIILKYLLFLIITIFLIVMISVLFAVFMYINGDFQEMLESGKTSSGS